MLYLLNILKQGNLISNCRYFVGWDARATWLLKSLLPDRILDAMYDSSMSSESTL
jgi:hypothetical protein